MSIIDERDDYKGESVQIHLTIPIYMQNYYFKFIIFILNTT